MPNLPSFDSFILLAGPIASGKTWTGDLIAESIPHSSRSTFSRGLTKLAFDRGIVAQDRDAMQRLGRHVVDTDWLSLWNATIDVAVPLVGGTLIVDGLRHVKILHELRRLHPGRVGLVVLDPPRDIILSRLAIRGEEVLPLSHPVESELDQLHSVADVSLRGLSAVVTEGSALTQLLGWLPGLAR